MSKSIDLEELIYVLQKQADEAQMSGRNHAYAKGLRDAQKIAVTVQAVTEEESIPQMGGIPREQIMWYECDKCHCSYDTGDQYCRKCGRRINWNANRKND